MALPQPVADRTLGTVDVLCRLVAEEVSAYLQHQESRALLRMLHQIPQRYRRAIKQGQKPRKVRDAGA